MFSRSNWRGEGWGESLSLNMGGFSVSSFFSPFQALSRRGFFITFCRAWQLSLPVSTSPKYSICACVPVVVVVVVRVVTDGGHVVGVNYALFCTTVRAVKSQSDFWEYGVS